MVFGGIILFLSNCTDLGTGSGKSKNGSEVSFAEDIQPIFNAYCAYEGCHVEGHITGLNLSGGISYSNLVNVSSASYFPLIRVLPTEPDSSVLYLKITGDPSVGQVMPPKDPVLNINQINLIEEWILDGAEDN